MSLPNLTHLQTFDASHNRPNISLPTEAPAPRSPSTTYSSHASNAGRRASGSFLGLSEPQPHRPPSPSPPPPKRQKNPQDTPVRDAPGEGLEGAARSRSPNPVGVPQPDVAMETARITSFSEMPKPQIYHTPQGAGPTFASVSSLSASDATVIPIRRPPSTNLKYLTFRDRISATSPRPSLRPCRFPPS